MFGRLIQKEIRQILLDFRFITIFAICVVLTVLSVYVGIQSYTRLLEQHDVVADMNRKFMYQFADCLARSVPCFLNLALLALLGFTGAYVTILRYDVR